MRYQQSNERRAVILMVVLSLLTLFAIVGVTFVLYADAEAAAARVAREAETAQRADMDPQQALSFLLSQIIYDVPDTTSGASSGLRGHSLGRTMYGYNSLTPGLNIIPYSGIGRVHTNGGTTWPYQSTLNTDDYNLVNYTWFSGDGFARDPEWYTATVQTVPGAAKVSGYYVGGNPPYTYPDLNSFFLAAVRSDGTVLAPSFHRPWLFNPGRALNDMTNANWANTLGRYLTLRPRPAEHPQFPAPGDAYGDVRNLPWSIDPITKTPCNDSIWIDPGGPVMTAPDGTPYKMLVAPCIIDLDNRINVGTAGNIEGGAVSRSNQGWFPSEVNLSALWSNCTALTPAGTPAANEWLNLFLGNPPGTQPAVPPTGYYGKYGKSMAPGGVALPPLPGGVVFPNGSPAHVYAQADLDGRNETAAGVATTGIVLPTTSAGNANPCFPTFPVGYGSGSPLERTYHPAYYDVYKSAYYNAITGTNDNVVFRPSDMEALLRPNNLAGNVDAGSSALISNLTRLCPTSLGGMNSASVDLTAPQRRNWITTVSSDLARPGLSPWIYNPATSGYLVNGVTTPSLPPLSTTQVPFTPFAKRILPATTPNPPVGSEYTASWQSFTAALGRLDLNRPLPPYPHMASGLTTMMTNTANDRFDVPSTNYTQPQIQTQLLAATAARQQLAIDVYLRLLAVTGVAPPLNVATPTVVELAPRRWLAQLAANIVDYIDDDEISTPFCFYNPGNPPFGLPALGANNYQVTPTSISATDTANTIPAWPPLPPTITGNPDVPTYWVFGTELPRIVINEALGESSYKANYPPKNGDTVNVNVWVELFNPLPAPGTVGTTATTNGTALQPQDGMAVPLYMPTVGAAPAYNTHQLVIASNNATVANSYSLWADTITLGMNNNVLGTPLQLRYTVPPTAALPNGTPAVCNFLEGNGTVYTIQSSTNPTTYSISGPAGGLPGQSFMLVGPSASGNTQPYNDVNSDITAANVTAASGLPATYPATVPWLQSLNMTYQVTTSSTSQWSMTIPPPPGSAAGTAPLSIPIADNTNTGILVLLRRLANPHLPYNPFTSTGGLTNPALPPNPYITVDYAPFVLNGYNGTKNPPAPLNAKPSSWGKCQPYAGQYTNQTVQMPPMTGVNYQTLGFTNAPLASPFTWLVHLDRALISPTELLHVSGFPPHLLTQRFIFQNAGASSPLVVPQPYNYTPPPIINGNPPAGYPAQFSCFQHYVPWFDQSRRLYRFFEMVDTRNAVAGVSPINGRVPGKININTLWDPPSTYPQIYQAIADPALAAINADNPNFTSANVTTIFQSLLTGRTPGLAIGALSAVDRPFVGMAAGAAPATDPQYPLGMGINHTLLTDGQVDASAAPTKQRVLQLTNAAPTNPQVAHPYMQNELLTKIYNRLTTRSNVYAVFLTVGFFQVMSGGAVGSPNIPQLGPEIGRSEGRQIRHRMFAIVDRTNLILSVNTPPVPAPYPTLTGAGLVPNPVVPGAGITVATGSPPLPYQVTFSKVGGTNPFTGAAWAINGGTTVVFEPGTDNEETVTLAGTSPGPFTAVFYKSHLPNIPVVLRGNPGPWTVVPYDPRLDPGVVLYFSIID
jgi:hypothetical protein